MKRAIAILALALALFGLIAAPVAAQTAPAFADGPHGIRASNRTGPVFASWGTVTGLDPGETYLVVVAATAERRVSCYSGSALVSRTTYTDIAMGEQFVTADANGTARYFLQTDPLPPLPADVCPAGTYASVVTYFFDPFVWVFDANGTAVVTESIPI